MGRREVYLAAGSALDVPPGELAVAVARAGFTGLGLRVSGEHRVSTREALRLRRQLDDDGLVVNDVEVIRIGDPGGEPHAVLDLAAVLGARWALVVSDLADMAATADALAALALEARAVGIRLGLEYMAWTTPSTPQAALTLARDSDVDVVCDVLHHHRVGAGPGDVAALVETGVLGWVQVCDAPAHPPQGGTAAWLHEARHERYVPGDGELPVGDLVMQVPFHVPFSVEVQSDRLQRTLDVVARTKLLHDAAQVWNTMGYRPK